MDVELPIISVIVDPVDLWDAKKGIYANPLERGIAWERSAEVTFLEASEESHRNQVGFHVPAGIRVHGYSTRSREKKSLRLYFRQEYGLSRLEYPLFTGDGAHNNRGLKRLVLHSGGQDTIQPDWTMLRTPLMSQLARDMDGYAAHCRPVLLFLNAELQGIYQIRNRIDERFFSDEYGIEIADEGESAARWGKLASFFETHDLTLQENYAYVQSQVDIANWIDYYLLQIYAASTDWIATNTRSFQPQTHGGRWHWYFWDVDWTFGLVPWGDHTFNMMDWFLTEDRPGFQENATPFLKLLENPDFRMEFLTRAADLLNGPLALDSVVNQFDELVVELRPDIHYEIGRWSSRSDWEMNVERMRTFIRYRPDFLRQHLVDHFDLDGTAELAFAPPATGKGSIAVNGVLVPESWQGIYFMGTDIEIVAVPENGFCFAGWLPADLPQNARLNVTVDGPKTFTPRFDRHCDQEPQPGDVVITRIQVDDAGEIAEGDWFELLVARSGGVDLRGWRITDNDTKTSSDEGSLIFAQREALSYVPKGTTILIIATESLDNDDQFPTDDLTGADRRMLLYAGNDNLDAVSDPWFNLTLGDSLVLLAPGPTASFHDDKGIAFAIVGDRGHPAITPASFGILEDGVTAGMPSVYP
jgi:hypothetical protein